MERTVIVYKNVFDRSNPKEFTFDDYLYEPDKIFKAFDLNYDAVTSIKTMKDKGERNSFKRNNLPAMDLSLSGLLAIDIDGISDNSLLKTSIIQKLMRLPSCYVIKESVSGNLVAFFKWNCDPVDYKFLFYKIYLELTILLGVNIDFLPEIGRLRYIGEAGFIHKNEKSTVLTEILNVGRLPVIKTAVTPNDARSIKYCSR